jgi:perosamine synthetase
VEALAQVPDQTSSRPVSTRSPGYVPALPTLWPSMLLQGARSAQAFPFDSPQVRWFYFARNAVWMAVKVLGLEGKEVLVPAYHHGVEIEALIDAGAKVKFFRVDEKMRPDLADVERQIGPETRGLYLIHYLGFPGPSAAFRALAAKHNLKFVEDCALALLSCDGQQPLGTTGDAGIFCLYKTLPTPHGGALVLGPNQTAGLPEPEAPPTIATARHLMTSLLMNVELRAGTPGRLLRSGIRALGRTATSAARVENVATGTQHFDRAHSGLGISPITLRVAEGQDAAEIVAARRRNYFMLLGRLRETGAVLFGNLPAGVCPLFFPLKVHNKEAVARALSARGVETVDFWRTGHPACDLDAYPEVKALRQTILEIPIHQDVTPQQADALADAVLEALREDRR